MIVAVLLFCCGQVAAAENMLYAPVLPADMLAGETYDAQIFEGTTLKGNATGRFKRNADDSISIDAAEGDNGGTLYFMLPTPLSVGRFAIDYNIQHTAAQTTARNIMLLRAENGSPLIYTVVLSKEGHLTRCPQTVNGTWVDYETQNEWYELRAVLERATTTMDWTLELFDKNKSLTTPIFKQTIAAATMPQLSEICFENWKLETTDNESLLTVGNFSISSLPTANAVAGFYNAEGEPISDLSESAQPVGVAKLTSLSSGEQAITLRLALYEKDAVIALAQKNISLAAGAEQQETIALPTETVYLPGQTLKLFIWSNALTPQAKAGTLLYSGSLKTAGTGDSLWLEFEAPSWLSAVGLTPQSFEITTPQGLLKEAQSVLYDPVGQTLRLKLSESDGFGTYTVQSSGLSHADGTTAALSAQTEPRWEYDVPIYSPSIQSIALYHDGHGVDSITTAGDYEAEVRVVGFQPGQTGAIDLYRRRGTQTERLTTLNITGSSDVVEVGMSFSAAAGDMISAAIR